MRAHEPIFAMIFADSWDTLPVCLKKHYANRPYCEDVTIMQGHMNIKCKWLLKPFFYLLRSMPPYTATHIPVNVEFCSETDSAAIRFKRTYHFKNKAPYRFTSHLLLVQHNEVREQLKYGFSWHALFCWDGTKVSLRHKGYSLQLGKLKLKLPIEWLVGRGNAYEWPLSDDEFKMHTTITHPLLGEIYVYQGQFKVSNRV